MTDATTPSCSPHNRAGPFVRRAALILPFVLLAIFAIREVGSPDIGFHLKAGEYILQGNGWPQTDPFTYTVRDHPYIDTSWGYQVVLTTAHRFGGAAGIVSLHLILLLAVFTFVALTCRTAGADDISTGLFLLIGVIACEMRCEARPELLSLAFLAALLYLCTRRAVGLRSPLWLLPILFVFWANAHSFFLLGWGVLGVFLAAELLTKYRIDATLLRWSIVAACACFLNPYGYRGVLFPLSLLTRFDQGNVFSQTIGELCSPFSIRTTAQMPFYPHIPIYAFRLIAVLSVISWIPLWRDRRYRDIFLSVVFLLISAKMLRNMPLFVVAALPGLAASMKLPDLLARVLPNRRIANASVVSLIAVVVLVFSLRTIHNATYIDDRRAVRFGWSWSHQEQPVSAAEYMNRVKLPGPLFNHLNYGAYLMWAQREPVFIDGRLELIGEAFYQEYLGILNDPGKFASATAKYGFRSVVLPHAIAPTLFTYMLNSTSWRLAYVDHLAAIFVKNDPDAAKFVDPNLAAILSERPAAPPFIQLPGLGGRPRRSGFSHWLHGTLHTLDDPREEYTRALFHFIRGDMPAAERLFSRVIDRTDGAHYELYLNLGSVLWRLNRHDEARACYRIVLEDDPENALAQKRLSDVAPN